MKNVDPIIWNLVDRTMKKMMLDHAKKCGASEKFLSDIEDKDFRVVYHVVYICYGESKNEKA